MPRIPPFKLVSCPNKLLLVSDSERNKEVVMFYFLMFEMLCSHSMEVLYVGVSCYLYSSEERTVSLYRYALCCFDFQRGYPTI